MDSFSALFNEIGPWAVVVFALVWLAYFAKDQIQAAREERTLEEKQHSEEVGKLSDAITAQSEKMTEALNNNTQAIIKLAAAVGKETE